MEHLSWTKIAERLAPPGRAQAMRSWLYQQLVNEDRKHPPAPAELLDHLRLYPAHALGKFRQGEICADCERLGLNAAVCFECGRMGFAQLYTHLVEKHPGCADDVYRDKHKYNRTTGLVSSEYQRRRSKETISHMKSMRARRKRVQPPAQKGRQWKNRTEALQNAVTRRAIEGRRAPRNVPTRFQRKHRISSWAIAKSRLQGETTLRIASKVDGQKQAIKKHSPLHQKVEGVCRSLGMGGAPVRYWRGQWITNQHLRDARADFRIKAKDLAAAMNAIENRLAMVLSGKERRPLSLDLADRLLSARKQYAGQRQSAAPTSKGGHVPRLCPSERRAISWQRKVLPLEIRHFGQAISRLNRKKTCTEQDLGEILCNLKRQLKVETLFFWALDFLPWLTDRYGSERDILEKQLVKQPAEVAREFLAAQYGQSENTIYLLPSDVSGLSTKTRTVLLDIHQIFDGRDVASTREILAALRKHRSRWKGLAPKDLAQMLRSAGAIPQNLRMNALVVKGYQLNAVPSLYTTAEAAPKIGVHPETLQLLARTHKIPAPPLLRRIGLQAGGRVRFWTDSDIRLAGLAIAENQARARTEAATLAAVST